MSRATVHQLAADARELAALAKPAEVLPLPADPRRRERVLLQLVLHERERSRRLLALLAD